MKHTIVVIALYALFFRSTLSNEKVLVSAKPQPCSKALRIMVVLVVGGAAGQPKRVGERDAAQSSRWCPRLSMGE